MDPLSQGVLGAVGATQTRQKAHMIVATVLGFLSGMAPDLDIFIRSSSDPLIALEYHRQFTHSLIFIPVGGFLCAIFFYRLFARKKLSFKHTYLYCTLGLATHCLLDACTTYGTMLLWPFSDIRVAWSTVSIIDPLFTLPLLLCVALNLRLKQTWVTHVALFWALGYLSFGFIQRERAEAAGWQLAKQRGLEVINLETMPSFANLLMWKLIITTDTAYYVDAVNVRGVNAVIIEGESVNKLDIGRDLPWLDMNSQQAKDIERFRWFSKGYLAISSTQDNTVADIRYSILPHEINALWGIRLDPQASIDQHVDYVKSSERSPEAFKKLWNMIKR